MVRKVWVTVKPKSKRPAIALLEDGTLLVRLASPPVDGKANAELVGAIAEYYAIPKSRVTITSGLTAKRKLVEIEED
ncbi:DUF167 domain-containing protein [Leptolyngbya sp. CCY15150]|uniref:DUF167 domain-containing protein n=1 Tax=Leptolyngbya sp. CCY15150 TaxID=2767772 RepID=UPI001952062B|nr:DUF167 domain-containing protein [Leptolyngbya sp. CCY15150]